MTDPNSPMSRSISVANLIRGLIALAAVIAIGAAFAAGRIMLALVLIGFVVLATCLGYWVWRSRQSP